MDLNETKTHLNALNTAIRDLQVKQAKLLKLQGLDDEILKQQEMMEKINGDLETANNTLKSLRSRKEKHISESMDKLRQRIDYLLPSGKCIVEIIEDGKIVIGWEIEGIFVRYGGLSEAQKTIFDQALSYAIMDGKNGFLIYEAATIDKDNLKLLLDRLLDVKFQVNVNTWYNPPVKGFSQILKKWNVIKK